MPVICPTCGTSNADGNKFCANCGTTLAAALSTPAGPPPAVTPPAATPPAATPPPQAGGNPPAPQPQAPIAQPQPAAPTPTAPVPPPGGTAGPSLSAGLPLPPRLSRPVLYGGLLAGVLVAAVIGVALGSSLGNHDPKPSPVIKPTPLPTARNTPAPTPNGGTAETPAPSPIGGTGETPAPNTPTPNTPVPATAAPTSAAGGTGQSQLVDVANISVTIPGDWKVATTKDYKIDVRGAKGGQLLIFSFALKQATTIDAYMQSQIDLTKKDATDFTICDALRDFTIENGPPGKEVVMCYTATRSDGSKYKAVDDITAALSADGGTLFLTELYAIDAVFDDFSKVAWNSVTPTIKWKLYAAP